MIQWSSVLLVSFRGEEIFAYTISSNGQVCIAASRPVVASRYDEDARVVEVVGAGRICEPEVPRPLADGSLALKRIAPVERESAGVPGQAYFNEFFDMDRQVKRRVEILESRATEKGGV